MRIEGEEVGRVAVLILDYDPIRESNPRLALQTVYSFLGQKLRGKYPYGSGAGMDLTVLANEELVAVHQTDFEEIGLEFFPNWRESSTYRDLLREGLRQNTDVYLMDDVDHILGRSSEPQYRPPYYILLPGEEVYQRTEIIDRNGRIDIRPLDPQFKIKSR